MYIRVLHTFIHTYIHSCSTYMTYICTHTYYRCTCTSSCTFMYVHIHVVNVVHEVCVHVPSTHTVNHTCMYVVEVSTYILYMNVEVPSVPVHYMYGRKCCIREASCTHTTCININIHTYYVCMYISVTLCTHH